MEDLTPDSEYLDKVMLTERLLTKAAEQPPNIPLHTLDQFEAAVNESRQQLKTIAEITGQQAEFRKGVSPPLVYLLAGVLDTNRCDHIVANPAQPTHLPLVTRTMFCDSCVVNIANWNLVIPDDTCDLCGAQPVMHFTPITVAIGMVIMTANVCDGCTERLAQ